MFGCQNDSELDIGSWEGQNVLKRKDVFVFVNEVDGRDLTLDNVPPKYS